jgi:hypothetical protein
MIYLKKTLPMRNDQPLAIGNQLRQINGIVPRSVAGKGELIIQL